jgi:hypothetical protein
MAWGIHGLPKVLLEPDMTHYSTPYRQPPLKRPSGHFRVGYLQGRWPAAVSLPIWISHAVRL